MRVLAAELATPAVGVNTFSRILRASRGEMTHPTTDKAGREGHWVRWIYRTRAFE
jgi:hypothetical protein